jgi:hypothetical protein
MYYPRYAIWAVGGSAKDKKRITLARDALFHLCMALAKIDYDYLREFPDTPLLYGAGVKYFDDSHLDCWKGTCRTQEDDWQDVHTCLEKKYGDCFPKGTLLLRKDGNLVPIEEIIVGDEIWGRDDWTTVEESVDKGILSVDEVELTNYSKLRLTGDHHMYVAKCEIHQSKYCDCNLEDRYVVKVRVQELKELDVLVAPKVKPNQSTASYDFRTTRNTLSVFSVKRNIDNVQCYDIQTSDHYVYLPEHDVTVSNCEDLCCWRVAELWHRGIQAMPFPRLERAEGGQLWHILVLWPDGREEDPSAILGMKGGNI